MAAGAPLPLPRKIDILDRVDRAIDLLADELALDAESKGATLSDKQRTSYAASLSALLAWRARG